MTEMRTATTNRQRMKRTAQNQAAADINAQRAELSASRRETVYKTDPALFAEVVDRWGFTPSQRAAREESVLADLRAGVLTQREIAKKYKMSASTVSMIKKYRLKEE